MATYSRLDDVERMDAAARALDNLETDAEMTARMAARGYDEAERAVGRALLGAAREEHRTQDREHGEKRGATHTVKALWRPARKVYMQELGFARLAFEDDPGAQEDLGLLGPRKRPRGAALDQAMNFYDSALARPELLAKLAAVGVTQEALEAGQARMAAVYAALSVQQGEKEGAKTATKKKGKALAALDTWMARFLKMARAEFADEPERLARLGL